MIYPPYWKEKITKADADHVTDNGAIDQRLLWRDKYITGLENALGKWETWKPDNEDLAALQEQARARDGSYTNGLAAQSAYIGGLEARLRSYESNSALIWANAAFTKLRNETDKRPPALPGMPDLLDELIAQFERTERDYETLRATVAAREAERDLLRVEWIPVSERLPDKNGHYLLFTESPYMHKQWDVYDGVYVGFCDLENDKGYEFSGDKGVTHWQPLPMPPKARAGGKA